MKQQIDLLDATPAKRLYHSIIADYDINMAMCELIDNALDIWSKNRKKQALNINILLDYHQQRIEISDNAGGIDADELSYLVGPGHTGNLETNESIGIFGVGTKRAVVALSQDISIKTRRKDDTFLIEFDDKWIEKEDWILPIYKIDSIPKGTTTIELLKLRKLIEKSSAPLLMEHLGATYSKFLSSDKVKIAVNKAIVESIEFDNWSYPPSFEPINYIGKLSAADGSEVRINAVAGLTNESSPAGGEYGVYFYCNDRLIARALKTIDVGFTTGYAGKPHADVSLTRVIVSLNGKALLMPWNSSKSDINSSHEIFVALQAWLFRTVKDFASLSRRLSKQEGGWPKQVFTYNSGEMRTEQVEDFPAANTSYLPPLPVMRPRYSAKVKKANAAVSIKKPWTTGLYESIIAADWILKQNFSQKNRIALLILDSTLEIAFKEYLVNDSGHHYSEQRLFNLFRNRHNVHNEIKNYVDISNRDWSKIQYFYDLRCQTIHRRTSVSIDDTDMANFRSVVERVLKKLFNLKFE